jgi:hypothetical protein
MFSRNRCQFNPCQNLPRLRLVVWFLDWLQSGAYRIQKYLPLPYSASGSQALRDEAYFLETNLIRFSSQC